MAEKPTFFLAIEANCDGRFSDNGFLLRPGVQRDITFISADVDADPGENATAINRPGADFTLRHLHAATYNQF